MSENIALREELEILIVKVVLKPALTLTKKLSPEIKRTASSSQASSDANKKAAIELSDEEDPGEPYI